MKSRFGNKLHKIDFFHSAVAGLLIFSTLLNFYFVYMNFNRSRVTKVVDGDSFETKDGRRIRLLGVDAPESDNCMGPQAKEALEIMIEGKVVKLANQVKDDYGRILANVFVSSVFVNKELVKKGLGKYNSADLSHHADLRHAYLEAKEKEEGIFSPLCRQTDPVSDCMIKANVR